MWLRFTQRARNIILASQDDAIKRKAPWVDTEHLLLALILETDSVAACVLARSGANLTQIRAEVERAMVEVEAATNGEPPLAPHAKAVLERAAVEARLMRHTYVGTEHLLLALLSQKEGHGGQILENLGLNLEKVRAEVIDFLKPEPAQYPEFDFDSEIPEVMVAAMELARASGHRMRSEHLLLALNARRSELMGQIFADGWTEDSVKTELTERLAKLVEGN